MSGEHHSKKQVAHVLVPSVARKVVDLGGDVEKACAYKLMANSMILGTMEVMAEALTFAEKAGFGSQRVFDLIQGLFFSSRLTLKDCYRVSPFLFRLLPCPQHGQLRKAYGHRGF